MTLLDVAIYFLACAAGSAVNAVAGGGTFITFPLLIVNGMTALQANIMSTIALWPGSVASAFAYNKEISVDKKALLPFMIASAVGGMLGTLILLKTPADTFKGLVPWLLLAATCLFTFGRYGARWLNYYSDDGGPNRRAAGIALQFIIAVYGGYFGAGIGILMLAMLQFLGVHEIHRMNAMKTVLGSIINAVAVLIFLFSPLVIWQTAPVMIAGAITGGVLGARLALRTSALAVRRMVSIVGFAMTAYFFLHGV